MPDQLLNSASSASWFMLRLPLTFQLLELPSLPLQLALLFFNFLLLLGLYLLLGLDGATGHRSSYPAQRSTDQRSFAGTATGCPANDGSCSCPESCSSEGALLSGRQRSSSTGNNEHGSR